MAKLRGYIKHRQLPLEAVLPYIGQKQSLTFWVDDLQMDVTVNLCNTRQLLWGRGIVCVSCGLKGNHFWIESNGQISPHLNLYAVNNDGHPILMTMDHIIPKSKGGTKTLDNVQLMCEKCNHQKGDKIV